MADEKEVAQAKPNFSEEKEIVGKIIDQYEFNSKDIPIKVTINKQKGEFVPIYTVAISSLSKSTEIILEKIRKELVKQVSLGMVEITDLKKSTIVEEKFKETIGILIKKYFPDADEKTMGFLTTYLIQKSLGMGNIEILMDDAKLEEIAINGSEEPVWIYHKKHGWLKTNIWIREEEQILHYATMIGRKVGRQMSILEPLLDAHIGEGDRVNATLMPISSHGNTITLRKFSRDPWTITSFIKFGTISPAAAAMIWEGIQYELSAIIAGGTASGKTSMLNIVANFFPPNQRIVSIEDTREIRLPKFLHWLPMNTRTANAESKGEVSMLDLLVNSLRMRPDRILVGEVRRAKEAEVLFEAIHTGHSVYATFHANNVQEVVTRLTSPPIEVPKSMLPGISMVIVQMRNRRTGMRRTFQIGEIMPDSKPNVLMQYDMKRDVLHNLNKSRAIMDTLQLYTGNSLNDIRRSLAEKEAILKYLVKKNIEDIDSIGLIMGRYYTEHDELLKQLKGNKLSG
ncbi:hypothetical protein COV93_00050 [Candidatus Woesearchaeota archaeon CG11_big_fil_rev_8_21_14_0_20_43_8]|nr:MAG: hypothetical protein COV93_00050 [Candidatus Woesearchaeota archaeon CG11_big_fil_rev_8_21_14_0_20_43_8]PIO06686.1 MAG: hypothetical protein COT47_03220 [Candidatus Woesearchaeota archaeon CG08_land_8_20_14_0_20_43_7]